MNQLSTITAVRRRAMRQDDGRVFGNFETIRTGVDRFEVCDFHATPTLPRTILLTCIDSHTGEQWGDRTFTGQRARRDLIEFIERQLPF